MVELIPPPDPRSLLPPLLACLPTAFASSRPPPSLLSLLSPILKQRLEIITSTSSSNDNWLKLLCWDEKKSDSLRDVVENTTFEPHPASGELEVGEVDPILYKRFDGETLRANLGLQDWTLNAVYLWCSGGENGHGWRLAELLPYENPTHVDNSWSRSIQEANESSRRRLVNEAIHQATLADRLAPVVDDDHDYWAQYDKSPGQTPAMKKSPAPKNGASETDYYARYGEVQPEMDNDDPSEEMEDVGESTLNGDALSSILSGPSESHRKPPPYNFPSNHVRDVDEDAMVVSQPHPGSPSTNGSDTVHRLEETAERYAASEVGIRQHIGTSMKSMFRLAKSAGIDREEFERIVHRELETLSMLDRDD